MDQIQKIERGDNMRILRPAQSVYDNPLPQLKSRQCVFPSIVQLEGGALLAAMAIGEALESVDALTHTLRSEDGGRTWSRPAPIFPQFARIPRSDTVKLTHLGGSRVAAFGYAFDRPDSGRPLGNPENGGMLDNHVLWAESVDGGVTWGTPQLIECAFPRPVEASAPLYALQDGSWATPITGMPDWGGAMHGPSEGRLLRSYDQGRTWQDTAVCMAFPGRQVTCYEQRMCQLASGTLIVIGWNEDLVTGARLKNHFTASFDGGHSFTPAMPTGVQGQASSVYALSGERLLALHAVRRDTERPGIYAFVVDFSGRTWKIVDEALLWQPDRPVCRNKSMADIFAFLKFGQPSAIRLHSGGLAMIHWVEMQGQYKVLLTEFTL